MRRLAAGSCLMLALTISTGAFAKTPKADNTAQNQGAMHKDAVTAEKQSNRKSDVTVLADVRKSIVADKNLSVNAKNVKILYSNGAVTLRGPVDSDEEKTKVEEIAKSCERVSSVKNMLTVKAK